MMVTSTSEAVLVTATEHSEDQDLDFHCHFTHAAVTKFKPSIAVVRSELDQA